MVNDTQARYIDGTMFRRFARAVDFDWIQWHQSVRSYLFQAAIFHRDFEH